MAEQLVQASIHFKFDPAKGTVGLVEFPEEVTVTLSVGDEVTAAKGAFDIDFRESISEKGLEWIEEKMMAAIEEAVRTAKPVEKTAKKKPAAKKTAPAKKKPAAKKDSSKEDMNLFD